MGNFTLASVSLQQYVEMKYITKKAYLIHILSVLVLMMNEPFIFLGLF